MTGLLVLFYFAGLLPESTTFDLLNLMMNPTNFPNLSVSTKTIVAIEGIALAGAIVVGIFARDVQFAVMGTLMVFFFNLLWDFIAVITRVQQENAVVSTIVFGSLLFGFVITAIDWWRGTD